MMRVGSSQPRPILLQAATPLRRNLLAFPFQSYWKVLQCRLPNISAVEEAPRQLQGTLLSPVLPFSRPPTLLGTYVILLIPTA